MRDKGSMIVVDTAAEAKLVEALSEIRPESETWALAVFHLSELLPQYQSDYQIKIAVNLMTDLLQNFDGGIYLFEDYTIAVLCNHLNNNLLGKLVFQLRYLYMDDPLAYNQDGKENPNFSSSWRLDTELDEAMDYATRCMMFVAQNKGGTEVVIQEDEQGGIISAVKKALFSASRLAHVERDLGHVELSKALRRQPVCAVIGAGTPRRVFDELYINIAHLRGLLKSEVDFLSNKWLFKYLTQLLDVRMLEQLRQQPGNYLTQAVSLNLNVETLLSDAFTELDAALLPPMKVSVVFEIPVVDVFADMAAYELARDTVQKLGYRVCIDGLTTHSIQHINRERLKADLLKLQWNADATSDLSTPENQALVKALTSCGTNRVILCRCDTKEAVEYGKALGISLFQGRYLDGLLNPDGMVEN